jgi:hypothetical protein
MQDGTSYVSVAATDAMDVNAKSSGAQLEKMEPIHSNGQPGDDVIIIESEGDGNKVGVQTSIREGALEDHNEHKCGNTDTTVLEEESTSTDDDSDSDLYGFYLRESENEQTSESDAEKDTEVCAFNYLINGCQTF